MIISKKQLAVSLSKLAVFTKADMFMEQYPTDGQIAADFLWHAYMHGDLEGKKIIDLGAGTGILGIGALLLDAAHVTFVEKDSAALEICKKNVSSVMTPAAAKKKCTYLTADVATLAAKSCAGDVVLQNPPFGTKQAHQDKVFLEKAFLCAPTIYTLHKTSTRPFVVAIVKDNHFKIIDEFAYEFPLKNTMAQHKKKIERIDVTAFYLVRQ